MDYRAEALIRDLRTAVRWADTVGPLANRRRKITEIRTGNTLPFLIGELWAHIQKSITEYNEV